LDNFNSVTGIGTDLVIEFKHPLKNDELEVFDAIGYRWQISNTPSAQAIA
jgi:hypothetical protein